MGYINDWKEALRTKENIEPIEGYPHRDFSPKAWSFVSFFLPLMAIPLAIKGVQAIAKAVKKNKEKKEAGKKNESYL